MRVLLVAVDDRPGLLLARVAVVGPELRERYTRLMAQVVGGTQQWVSGLVGP